MPTHRCWDLARSACARMTSRGWSARPICCARSWAGSPRPALKRAFAPPSRRFAGSDTGTSLEVITVSLMGGLGNQMFQYAAGKALAERHGVRLALDLSGFRNYPLRSFLLDRLCVPEADLAIVSEDGRPAGNFARSRWRQRMDRV